MFRRTTDESRASSPQTRASHGTKMLAPEVLAAEYGRKEWKHFTPDSGMACRSGMGHVWGSTAIPSPVVLDPEPGTSGHKEEPPCALLGRTHKGPAMVL